MNLASLVFPRATSIRQSAPARQQNGKTYWVVGEHQRQYQDNAKTLARASCRGAEMGGASMKYVEKKGFGNATLCTGHFVQLCIEYVLYTFVQTYLQKLCSQFVYGSVNGKRHCSTVYTRVHFCTIVHSFCTVLRSSRGRGGMRRFYTHLQAASWRQFCAILLQGGSHWWRCQRGQTTRMDEAPNAAIRSRRQFAKTLEGRTSGDQL